MIRKSIFIFVILFLIVACTNSKESTESKPKNVLIQYDSQDLKRMKEFVARFHNGKSDYVLAITSTIEGDYVIYDIRSNGIKVTINIDYSRDKYSSENTKSYMCDDALIRKETDIEGDKNIFEIKNCTGSETFDKAGILTFKQ